MKRNMSRFLALALGLTLLTACGPKESVPTSTPAESPMVTETPDPSAAPTPDGAGEAQLRVSMLKGPTGLGAAKLMADAEAGETELSYSFDVFPEPQAAVAALSKGEVDIAALPTNLASVLYHKNEDVQLLALNTLGVLYILENGQTVNSMADLSGRTICATGQGANPEYVLNFLLEQNGLTPGEDVEIRWMASDELVAAMASGEVELGLLPVPAATSVLIKNQDVRTALSLNDVWEQAEAEGMLTMGCVVVRTEFAQENPQLVETFMEEYSKSIDFVADEANREEAAKLAETYGIVPKAAIAQKALPDANLCFITGEDMMAAIQGYYGVLYAADPDSIGGSIPDGSFYYDYKK